MKYRFYAILTLLVLFLLASCGRHRGRFILRGTVQDSTDTILVVGFDQRFDRVDTIACNDGEFKWVFRPDTVTTLILVLPDGRRHPVFAEKGVESTITVPSDTGLFNVSGGYCNDSYQRFYLASVHDSAASQTFARIDSFITRDPFSEVTPYIICSEMVQRYHADESVISKMIGRMSGNMQDAPYLTTLKAEFTGSISNSAFISNMDMKDSTGVTVDFQDIATTTDYILTCIWTSWAGNGWREARKGMDSLRIKYEDRHLIIADISVDVNYELWKNTISKDTLAWTSYVDTKGWESKMIKTCKIMKMPVYVLFSGSRRVITVSQSLDDIERDLVRVIPAKEEPKSKTPKKKQK